MTKKTTIKPILFRLRDERTLSYLQRSCTSSQLSYSQQIEYEILQKIIGKRAALRAVRGTTPITEGMNHARGNGQPGTNEKRG